MEQKHPIAWHVPNLINICIDSVDDGEMTGKIYHCYSEEAIAFSNIIRMIETVEEFFDCLQFPQAATQTRSFHRKESVQGQKLEKKVMCPFYIFAIWIRPLPRLLLQRQLRRPCSGTVLGNRQVLQMLLFKKCL